MSRVISSAEVKNHRQLNDLWLIIHNDVYDVTKFTEEHPGGADTLLEVAGIDGTEAFEDAGHSTDARTLMKKYKIGTLPASEHTKYSGSCSAVPPKQKKSSRSSPRRASTKTWRTFDGSPSSQSISPNSEYRTSSRIERRVQAIVMPLQQAPAPAEKDKAARPASPQRAGGGRGRRAAPEPEPRPSPKPLIRETFTPCCKPRIEEIRVPIERPQPRRPLPCEEPGFDKRWLLLAAAALAVVIVAVAVHKRMSK